MHTSIASENLPSNGCTMRPRHCIHTSRTSQPSNRWEKIPQRGHQNHQNCIYLACLLSLPLKLRLGTHDFRFRENVNLLLVSGCSENFLVAHQTIQMQMSSFVSRDAHRCWPACCGDLGHRPLAKHAQIETTRLSHRPPPHLAPTSKEHCVTT